MLKRILFRQHWFDHLFFYFYNEISLEERGRKYWDKYITDLTESIDGELILEQANLNVSRETCLE